MKGFYVKLIKKVANNYNIVFGNDSYENLEVELVEMTDASRFSKDLSKRYDIEIVSSNNEVGLVIKEVFRDERNKLIHITFLDNRINNIPMNEFKELFKSELDMSGYYVMLINDSVSE